MPEAPIANFLFEARFLKQIPRSGFAFLGAGKESVAEHSFSTSIIAYVMASLSPDINPLKLITMCLLHDLPEARTGDLNSVQKCYDHADETAGIQDMVRDLVFGQSLFALLQEFNEGISLEARLARDADQIALILELKYLSDKGFDNAQTWIPPVMDRLKTSDGKRLAEQILKANCDSWWLNKFIDTEK
ncbi:MAG: HD domain-containing protein [Desulfatirhabdiaceae bacterium]